jgi:hypothetical protein
MGVFLTDAPRGKGRVSVYAPIKLTEIANQIEQAEAECAEAGGGKTVTPAGCPPYGRDGKDPKCFGTVATDHEKARRREEERLHTAKLLVKSEHHCKVCGFRSENRDVFMHVANEHPDKGLPDLQIVSSHRCDVCKRAFDWWNDAVRHVLLLSGKNESSDSRELIEVSAISRGDSAGSCEGRQIDFIQVPPERGLSFRYARRLPPT